MFTKEELERKYLVEHLTMAEIAKEQGTTRQTVLYYLKKYGIDRSKAERFEIECSNVECGKMFPTTRKRWRERFRGFCSPECYYASRRNPAYREWRQGQRIGRIVMSEELGRQILGDEVVHHKDGNDGNNDKGNLMLFESHSEHMIYHHRLQREGLP